MFVDSVAGASFDGDFDVDFFAGGQAGPEQEYQFPEPRLRMAKFTLHWPRTELLLGGETPLISDLNPVTVASVGVPGFSEAGNLWNWLPQVRAHARDRDDVDRQDGVALGDPGRGAASVLRPHARHRR